MRPIPALLTAIVCAGFCLPAQAQDTEDLARAPRIGAVTATVRRDAASLWLEPRPGRDPVAVISGGERVAVLGRTVAEETADDSETFWYRVVTQGGVEGWTAGSLLDIDTGRIGPLLIDDDRRHLVVSSDLAVRAGHGLFISDDPETRLGWAGHELYDGLIVHQDAGLYETPAEGARKTGRVEDLAPAMVLRQTRQRLTTSHLSDPCGKGGYHWFLVLTSSGQAGWVNGRDFFRLTGYGDMVLVEGEEYEFRLVSDTSIGPSDQGGPTGCNRMFLPHFVRYSDGAIIPIWYDEAFAEFEEAPILSPLLYHGGRSWLLLREELEDGDGAVVDVGVRHIAGSDYPCLWVLHQTQEGRGVSYLMLRPYDGYFAVIRHDYSPANEGD